MIDNQQVAANGHACMHGTAGKRVHGSATYCLIVDNNPDHQELASLVLEGLSIASGRMEHSADCWHRILLERPQAVIIDIEVGQDSCWTLLQQIEQHPDTRSIPIICLSTNADLLDEAQSTHSFVGGARFIQKPFDLDELESAIGELIAEEQADENQSSFAAG